MKLYLIRHGESEYNVAHRHSGWSDVALTEKGREQARLLQPYLAKIPFDLLYASDLHRAVQTSQLAIPGCSCRLTPLLREHSSGSLVGRAFTDCEAQYGDAYRQARATADYKPFDGEDLPMLRRRVQAFLDLAAASGAGTAAAFSHAGFMRETIGCVLGVQLRASTMRAANCTVAILEHDDGKWLFNSWINPAELLR